MESPMIVRVKADGLEHLNGAIERAIEAVKILNKRDKMAKAYLVGKVAEVRARQKIESKPSKADCRYPEDYDPGMVLASLPLHSLVPTTGLACEGRANLRLPEALQ
ncbi:MAG: hypothetical protein K0B84_08080 [Firmicutes bacterium]|nr:hypothetical protein [Bacillota bacterium]